MTVKTHKTKGETMRAKLKYTTLVCGLALGVAVAGQAADRKENKWSLDLSLYGMGAAMSGDVTVKGIPAGVDLDFDKIWDNLDSAGMGTVRIGYGKWALNTDVIYMGLEGSKGSLDVELDQWMVEPTVSFRPSPVFELLAGARYNNMSAEISGGPFGLNPSGTQDWWDPIVGAVVNLPLTERLSINARGDVGGFGVGSDLTWQAFPYLSWQFAQWGSIQAGYRWMYIDYEDGSGTGKFSYDMLIQGPQLGFTLSF